MVRWGFLKNEESISLHGGQINHKGSCFPFQGSWALTEWPKGSNVKRNEQMTISNHSGSRAEDREEEKITYIHAKNLYKVSIVALYVNSLNNSHVHQQMNE